MGNKKSKNATILDEKEIQLIQHKTGMSRSEIQAWHESFIRDQPDGMINKKEFENIFRQFYPEGNPSKYAKLAFKAFDTDNSGKITFAEFMIATAFVSNGRGDHRQGLEFAFDIYDADNNQKIDKKELTQMISAIYDMEGHDHHNAKKAVEDILARYDSDHSKSLTKQEFINFITHDPVTSRAFY